MACYANKELYSIMTTVSITISACAENLGKYPNGKTARASFCLFDNTGTVCLGAMSELQPPLLVSFRSFIKLYM